MAGSKVSERRALLAKLNAALDEPAPARCPEHGQVTLREAAIVVRREVGPEPWHIGDACGRLLIDLDEAPDGR